MRKTKMRKRMTVFIMMMSVFAAAYAHEGHDKPDVLPPVGPHGGKYTKMVHHFAEVVVTGDMAMIYILEDDIKSTPEKLSDVKASLETPGKGTTSLKLSGTEGAFHANISIPKNVRRVYFHISAKVDGKLESGKVLYEPK